MVSFILLGAKALRHEGAKGQNYEKNQMLLHKKATIFGKNERK